MSCHRHRKPPLVGCAYCPRCTFTRQCRYRSRTAPRRPRLPCRKSVTGNQLGNPEPISGSGLDCRLRSGSRPGDNPEQCEQPYACNRERCVAFRSSRRSNALLSLSHRATARVHSAVFCPRAARYIVAKYPSRLTVSTRSRLKHRKSRPVVVEQARHCSCCR